MVALTIGMATYNDFDGVYFTLQALRLYHDLSDTEILVVDNAGCAHTRRFVEGWARGRYILDTEAVGTAAPRDRVFREAQGEAVLCCDSHVLFVPGSIARLKSYYREHPDTRDLLQGPLVYDDLRNISTHFEPVWREQMWGIWATDERGLDPEGEPFEIPMQGLGVFSCRKDAWPGFNPGFRGFGGEEGYIHEKFRQRGGRVVCLPWLRWGHRFGRPSGVPYPLFIEDKLRNYLIGHAELGLDPAPVLAHFAQHLSRERVQAIAKETLRESPRQPKEARHRGKKRRRPAGASPSVSRQPLISCILPTYHRPPTHHSLVEEAIESFLRQDYPNKELIVLNDCAEQELVCDAPGVRVVNQPERFPTLGDKYDAGVDLSRGELIAPWDDDDISLPWRLSLSRERLGDADYFNPLLHWYMVRDQLHRDLRRNVGHNLSLYRRTAFDAVGRRPSVGAGIDLALDQAFRAKVRCIRPEETGQGDLAPSDVYYLYRWGVSPVHLSASGKDPAEKYARVGARPVQKGRFVLHPHWRVDYEAETRHMIAALANWHGAPHDASPARPDPVNGDGGNSVKARGDPDITPVMLFVVGGAGPKRTLALRDFPRCDRRKGEAKIAHLGRVIRQIDDAVAAGGTHLLVPRDAADWLGDHPLLVDYFAAQHELVEASPETGIVFALSS